MVIGSNHCASTFLNSGREGPPEHNINKIAVKSEVYGEGKMGLEFNYRNYIFFHALHPLEGNPQAPV